MTMDKQRKRSIRAAQQTTGRRYTPLAREANMTADRGPTKTFLLADLLRECTTFPEVLFDEADPDDKWAPRVFASDILGTVVPFGTVLALAGTLAAAGRDSALRLESLTAGEAVVTYNNRRFQLTLNQDRQDELCRRPGCPSSIYDDAIAWCHVHLPECDVDTLVHVATEWGYARREWADDNPDLCGGGRGADRLIQAAVRHGAFEQVTRALMDTCFDDPQVIAESTFDDGAVMRLRHAIDRERLRLEGVATAELRRLRTKI
ncbi:hypothetical protein ACIQ7Q_24360 [Streptomyces sp. NPDC096176]|uniref:hypothetical protein n=1 Tax=Streptomyces sp. NPDC096176 TaxID=3366079 RepID=UPI003821FB78